MYNSQPYSFMNNYAFMSKGNEPITVTGLDGAKAYPTMPNSRLILFDTTADVFYCKETDSNNFPTIKTYTYTEVKPTSNVDSQYVTLEEFNKFKEELLNGEQFVRANTISAGGRDITVTTNQKINDDSSAKSDTTTNAGKSNKTKSTTQ